MLSLARHRRTLVVQLLFLSVNGLGLLLGLIYNGKVPNLYENNLHHTMGWIVSLVVFVQCVLGIMKSYTRDKRIGNSISEEQAAFIPSPAIVTERLQATQTSTTSEWCTSRYSHDSGHGTEPSSSRSHSISSPSSCQDQLQMLNNPCDMNMAIDYDEKVAMPHSLLNNRILYRLSALLPNRVIIIMSFIYDVIDRLILFLGFILVISGAATYGGVFVSIFSPRAEELVLTNPQRGGNIFNGLAHTIKGGIFFWYGLLTLGRWMGCFVEFGWAWNIKPPVGVAGSQNAAMPSAEFIESFVIFLYGSTNVFLEHLAAWGEAWSPSDLEHVSISIMFFGGGLVSFSWLFKIAIITPH